MYKLESRHHTIMRNIQSGRVLIIPDVHQNLQFVAGILEHEEHWDHIVFLGDYLDCNHAIDNIQWFSVRSVLEWAADFNKAHADNVTWLLGNHDMSYLGSYKPKTYARRENIYSCSGWTRSAATAFNKYVDKDWLDRLELCVRLGDWVAVHGGFHAQHFHPNETVWEGIERMHTVWEEDRRKFKLENPFGDYWLHCAGESRSSALKGTGIKGSPIWLDFVWDFKPIDGLNQIVGHTGFPPNPLWAGENNVCLDGQQRFYGVWADNYLTVKQCWTHETVTEHTFNE